MVWYRYAFSLFLSLSLFLSEYGISIDVKLCYRIHDLCRTFFNNTSVTIITLIGVLLSAVYSMILVTEWFMVLEELSMHIMIYAKREFHIDVLFIINDIFWNKPVPLLSSISIDVIFWLYGCNIWSNEPSEKKIDPKRYIR